jgi:hypothetical protein
MSSVSPGDVMPDRIAPDSGCLAFNGVVLWALTLCGEIALEHGGRVSEAAVTRLVEEAWRCFDAMCGAELDTSGG